MTITKPSENMLNLSTDVVPIPTVVEITASGNYSKTSAAVRYIEIEAIGGGGAGGGVAAGAAGTAGAASGGGAGFYGKVGPIDVSELAGPFSVAIGSAGVAGAAGANNGGGGSFTSITIGATSYVWGGAGGGVGITANAGARVPQLGSSPSGSNVLGSGRRASANGFSDGGSSFAQGGYGADSPFGTGGAAPRLTANGATAGGAAGATNYGSGGAGGVVVGASGNVAGGAGAAGFMRITEYY